MSTPGRGRGYSGRHHVRETRPGGLADRPGGLPDRPGGLSDRPGGDWPESEDADAARTLAELSPRATEPREMDPKEEREKADKPEGNKGEDDAIKELLTIDEQYAPLLTLLDQFSPGEDGIQFNRKLRHFETTITSMCPDEARLQSAFATLRAGALTRGGVARKLAGVGASFTRQQRQQLLRAALLNVVMQGTFSKLDVLERSNPLFLINAANLMGDYFAEARLCNGNKVHILASPLLQYMRALLASDDIRAHRSLATQLMQNGRELLSVLAQELDELSISIRLRLLSPPPVSIIWLLLSSDLCLNKFLPLPNTLQQFYAAHLELTSDENYSEVSYGSWKKSPEKDEFRSESSDGSVIDKVGQNVSQISLNDDDKPKLRPILGAGAGLLRQEQALSVSQDNFDTWTTKNNLSKRYDLNSWRQTEEDAVEEPEPVFNPTVLPPVVQSYPVTVPDYPPPRFNFQENFANYLQQGDGSYIQNQYTTTTPPSHAQGDFVPQFNERQPPVPERVNNEVQKSCRRQVENWRKEKTELKDDPNKRQRNWKKSKDNLDEDREESERSLSRNSREIKPGRLNRRNSDVPESGMAKTPPKRHVTEVPRNHKYWDHDDRCDKDYNS